MLSTNASPTSHAAATALALWAHWKTAAAPMGMDIETSATAKTLPQKMLQNPTAAWAEAAKAPVNQALNTTPEFVQGQGIPVLPSLPHPSMPPWRPTAQVGHRYAVLASSRYCQTHGVKPAPSSAWQWTECSRTHARCARLRQGGLRVATPSPSTVVGVMLLAHELAHAALELQHPGSLADTHTTERFALGCEAFAGEWLLSTACPEYQNLLLAQALAWWRCQRNHEFGVQHVVLAHFEQRVWQAAQAMVDVPAMPSHAAAIAAVVEWAWQSAHAQFGTAGVSNGWATHPLICHKPGSARQYTQAWQEAIAAHPWAPVYRECAYVA